MRRTTPVPAALLALLLAACPSPDAKAPAPEPAPPLETPDSGGTLAAAPRSAEAVSDSLFERTLSPLAEPAGGVVGIAAVHVESGRRVALRPAERFPMASVSKLPVALALLHQVDLGRVDLDDPVAVTADDLLPGASRLRETWTGPREVPVGRLLQLMLAESDNSATDLLLPLAGGPDAVTRRLRDLGMDGIDVSRPEGRQLADWAGLDSVPTGPGSHVAFLRAWEALPPEARRAAADRFDHDPRDTATPRAMAELAARLQKAEVGLSPRTRSLLLSILEATTTGRARLAGGLPAGTPLAHKTGTVGGTTNDVGIVTLPDGSHLAVAVFVKESDRPKADRERAIATIGRAIYDHFARPLEVVAAAR